MTAQMNRMLELMNQILEVRYENLDLEYELCLKLLEMASEDQYTYGIAFAYVYLVDSYMAQNGSLNSSVYIREAKALCEANGYDELLLPLCNFAGAYYRRAGDEQAALLYYLSGLDRAKAQNNYSMESALNNNIGIIFQNRGDVETSKTYFKHAYDVLEPHITEKDSFNCVLYLCNLSEVSQLLGQIEDSEHYLKLCEKMDTEAAYKYYRLDVGWCGHYAACRDVENCERYLKKVLNHHLESFKDPYYAYEAMLSMTRFMLEIDNQRYAKLFLDYLDRMGMDTDWDSAFILHELKVDYCKRFGTKKEMAEAYRQFYELMKSMEVVNNKVRVDGILSKINLIRAIEEKKAIVDENARLEDASHVDEITGLYNRRYFNKLITKVFHRQDLCKVGMIMLDVDYFKQYNDFYGHQKGDAALVAVAESLKKGLDHDICPGRYGGDEFVCLCVNMTDEEVNCYMHSVFKDIKNRWIRHDMSECSEYLTLSAGFCNEYYTPELTADMLLERADQALYEAKRAGRNRYIKKQRMETRNA